MGLLTGIGSAVIQNLCKQAQVKYAAESAFAYTRYYLFLFLSKSFVQTDTPTSLINFCKVKFSIELLLHFDPLSTFTIAFTSIVMIATDVPISVV